MDKNSRLSKEEKDFLKRYQSNCNNRFRELLAYCTILSKLTND